MKEQQQEWRVIGGQEAYPNSWPWQVSVQFAKMSVCGGAILNQNWVLSATHCFFRSEATRLRALKNNLGSCSWMYHPN